MKLPKLLIKLAPDSRCVRCAQTGYVAEKAELCLACLNVSLLIYAKRKKGEYAASELGTTTATDEKPAR